MKDKENTGEAMISLAGITRGPYPTLVGRNLTDKLYCVECEGDLPLTREQAMELDEAGPMVYPCSMCKAELDTHELALMDAGT